MLTGDRGYAGPSGLPGRSEQGPEGEPGLPGLPGVNGTAGRRGDQGKTIIVATFILLLTFIAQHSPAPYVRAGLILV